MLLASAEPVRSTMWPFLIPHIKNETGAEGKDQVFTGKAGLLGLHILCTPWRHFWFMGGSSGKAGLCSRLGSKGEEMGECPQECPGEDGRGPGAPSPCHILLPQLFQS